MRVTIDLPDDLYQIVTAMSRDKAQTLSQTVVELIRRGLGDTSHLAPVQPESWGP